MMYVVDDSGTAASIHWMSAVFDPTRPDSGTAPVRASGRLPGFYRIRRRKYNVNYARDS